MTADECSDGVLSGNPGTIEALLYCWRKVNSNCMMTIRQSTEFGNPHNKLHVKTLSGR